MEDRIFAALNRLRVRKCRPDLDRILCVLGKEGEVDHEVVINLLEEMTDKHQVLRVEYKGSVSYRDCRGWSKANGSSFINDSSYCNAVVLNSCRTSSAVRKAVCQLSTSGGTVSFSDLEEYFKCHPRELLTSAPLQVVIKREVNAGHLQTRQGGYLCQSSTSSDSNGSVLGGKRLKKAKKIFDPSDTGLSCSLSSTDEIPSTNSIVHAVITTKCEQPAKTQRRVCKLCSSDDQERVMLVCLECGVPFHLQCLGYSQQLSRVIQTRPWVCMDCKTCVVCEQHGGELIFCDYCDQAYHMKCHQPIVRRQPLGEWICTGCRGKPAGRGRPSKYAWLVASLSKRRRSDTSSDKEERDAEESRCSSSVTSAVTAPSMNTNWRSNVVKCPEDPAIPDVSTWSTSDVASFFSSRGFARYAGNFQENGVDGAALLMMDRDDVLSSLKIKLGPALKILNYVRLFQTRNSECLDFCYL